MTLQGIDLSSNNGSVNLNKVSAPIVISKLTGGLDYFWKNNLIDESLKAHKLAGAYHFEDEYHVHSKIKEQAYYFFKHFKPYLGKVLPILDYEVPLNDKIFTQHDINRIDTFCREFKRLSGVNCVVYCSKYWTYPNNKNEISTPFPLQIKRGLSPCVPLFPAKTSWSCRKQGQTLIF